MPITGKGTSTFTNIPLPGDAAGARNAAACRAVIVGTGYTVVGFPVKTQISRICINFNRLYPFRMAGFFMDRNKEDRISWAVVRLGVKPADHLLEIGCGTGQMITSIAAVLTTGTITAVDRSPAMVEKAARRNEIYIKKGQLTFLTGAFTEVQLPRSAYDKIFAFNVNLFQANAGAELSIIQEHLVPGGAFYLFFQPPPTTVMEGIKAIAGKAKAALQEHGFMIVSTTFKKLVPAPVCCIVSRPRQ